MGHTHTPSLRFAQGPPYLGDELKESVGIEGPNGESNEEEEKTLVTGFLHEGNHASPQEGAEGNNGDTEKSITPH